MELKHIAIEQLAVSPANMRGGRKLPDIANILPSIRARGVLVPLIVRPRLAHEDAAGVHDAYEIVAGRRRYHAALIVAAENDGIEPLPCAVMDAGDDAAALEASLIENVARLDPDEVTRWETFTRLVREGRTPDAIALTFGLTALQVKRTLALGNLLPRIRTLYRTERIDAPTVRHLTLASKIRQREWLALADNQDARAPTGQHLKAWLFGGASIPNSAALFDVTTYPGEIVTDLFDDSGYFGCRDTFWAAQNEAIEQRADAYRAQGWTVTILPQDEPFHSWEHERCPRTKGGKVVVVVTARGDVTFHEGYITLKDARKRDRGEAVADKPERPEVSAAMENYVDLHRHAAVRASLPTVPGLALRVMLAHVMAGSPLWHVRIEPQRAATDAIAESVENSTSEAAFDERRRAVLTMLGFDPETPTVTGGYDGEHGVVGLLAALIALPDAAVMDTLAVVMAETLDIASPVIELVGHLLNTDMANVWHADDALLDLIRDRSVLGAILTEVAGADVATANQAATGKITRQIVRDCLAGNNGRTKIERWVPRWMAFPPSAYTARGGIGSVDRATALSGVIADIAVPCERQPQPQSQSLRVAA